MMIWEEYAYWIGEHVQAMLFTLHPQYPAICTVWFEDDLNGDKMAKMGEILRTLFGAYLCGPASNVVCMGPTHQSFGFWNQELLDNARRVFLLPAELQPGTPVYIGGVPDECWSRIERAYNKRPVDLPQGRFFYK